jgi:hypothetical protein
MPTQLLLCFLAIFATVAMILVLVSKTRSSGHGVPEDEMTRRRRLFAQTLANPALQAPMEDRWNA